jgi:hypothetical protein
LPSRWTTAATVTFGFQIIMRLNGKTAILPAELG